MSAAAASTPGCLATPLAEEAERFAARSGERFPFLDPARIKDAAGKRPGEPGHNPRTLHIPASWYKDHKVAFHRGTYAQAEANVIRERLHLERICIGGDQQCWLLSWSQSLFAEL